MRLTLPKWELGSPPRLSKVQSSIAGIKTPHGKKKGRESNWHFDSQPLKVGNQPDLDACRCSATLRWKALNESYKFARDLTPIRGLGKEL